ncbi:hypothetical protein I7I51_01689 [Histoplasma capsulatum]|uniref:Uncharacterized protein n=1 Tax=Ajellomyces capsulatus TaxID=5037 RepID=A0A8A1MHM2_AJECA|nr:hypothetical protein I7I51_01689 [Histoplasma capsulatum]
MGGSDSRYQAKQAYTLSNLVDRRWEVKGRQKVQTALYTEVSGYLWVLGSERRGQKIPECKGVRSQSTGLPWPDGQRIHPIGHSPYRLKIGEVTKDGKELQSSY